MNFSHPEQPVIAVSWFEAVKFCEWLSTIEGRKYRLPTEAEWERAARGGVESALFPWGDDPPESLPNYRERWKAGPEPVARSMPNAFGLYDMCQNVHEWCSDWYQSDYYAVSAERNPRGPESGERRASRGGSWRHHIKVTRCAARSSIPPQFQYADYGFRVACDVDELYPIRRVFAAGTACERISRSPCRICFRSGAVRSGKGSGVCFLSPLFSARKCWRAPAMVNPSS